MYCTWVRGGIDCVEYICMYGVQYMISNWEEEGRVSYFYLCTYMHTPYGVHMYLYLTYIVTWYVSLIFGQTGKQLALLASSLEAHNLSTIIICRCPFHDNNNFTTYNILTRDAPPQVPSTYNT